MADDMYMTTNFFHLGPPNNTYSTDGPALVSSSTSAEGAAGVGTSYVQLKADSRNITRSNGWNDPLYGNWIYYFMRRAPGFFDEVCYTGTYTNRTVAHNLAAAPQLMIIKSRSAADRWSVYSATVGPTGILVLNTTAAADTSPGREVYWNNTAPTASVFSLGPDGDVNNSGANYVAYLFASAPGVSRVGSYTGNGSSQTINCGFTGGARFVMVKRTDSTGNWMVVDTARGLVAAGDPTLYLNSTAAEVTGVDWLDPDSSGFIVNQEGTMNANVSSATYIYLAIS